MSNPNAFPETRVFTNRDGEVDSCTEAGMSLRDYFATNAPTDEVQELNFRHLSRLAQERITGLKYPERPRYEVNSPGEIEFQLAEFDFKCAVNAAIRFRLADAMIRARQS